MNALIDNINQTNNNTRHEIIIYNCISMKNILRSINTGPLSGLADWIRSNPILFGVLTVFIVAYSALVITASISEELEAFLQTIPVQIVVFTGILLLMNYHPQTAVGLAVLFVAILWLMTNSMSKRHLVNKLVRLEIDDGADVTGVGNASGVGDIGQNVGGVVVGDIHSKFGDGRGSAPIEGLPVMGGLPIEVIDHQNQFAELASGRSVVVTPLLPETDNAQGIYDGVSGYDRPINSF